MGFRTSLSTAKTMSAPRRMCMATTVGLGAGAQKPPPLLEHPMPGLRPYIPLLKEANI